MDQLTDTGVSKQRPRGGRGRGGEIRKERGIGN